MINTVYIIGDLSEVHSASTRKKFFAAQVLLENKGFRVCNPLQEISNTRKELKFIIKSNIDLLLLCNFVYILPCINVVGTTQNIELLLAIKLNLYILHTC